jgi:hypothetical protein
MAKILASFDTENGALIVMVDGSAVEADYVCLDAKGPYANLSHMMEKDGVMMSHNYTFRPQEDDMDESMSTQAVADVKNYFGVR